MIAAAIGTVGNKYDNNNGNGVKEDQNNEHLSSRAVFVAKQQWLCTECERYTRAYAYMLAHAHGTQLTDHIFHYTCHMTVHDSIYAATATKCSMCGDDVEIHRHYIENESDSEEKMEEDEEVRD